MTLKNYTTFQNQILINSPFTDFTTTYFLVILPIKPVELFPETWEPSCSCGSRVDLKPLKVKTYQTQKIR